TTKSELVEDQSAHPPFGRFLTYPIEQYRYFHQTSGTTGRPLKCLDTAESWDWWERCWGYVYRGAGVGAGDVVFCAFSFGPYLSHWAAISGAWHVGAMCISGGGMTSEQRLQTIIDNHCTVLVCTPTYALHMSEVALRLGVDLPSSSVSRSIHAGEPGASLPNVRRAIEQAWGVTCFDHAGATEAGAWAFDCQARTGAIHLNEAEFIFEVIDPESSEPAGEDSRGELVITNLGRAAMPVLRYRTGDVVEVTTEPCPCGRSFARIKGGVLGRADDMIIVRGVNLYPSAIDNLIRSLPHVAEYEVAIRRIEGMDDLVIRCETTNTAPAEETVREVIDAFRRQFSIRVTVEHALAGSLPRFEFKARRFKRV
ncbi:MAG TPA: AMP-binding protein, partial [Blastocatellia bacterium]|nr:AMP-binding protein [Blastocatellia bacterium]